MTTEKTLPEKTAPDPSSADPSGTAATPALPRGVVPLLVVSAFVVILNETIMGVALPQLMADLDISAARAQWLTSAFLLTMAVVIPLTGWLLQRFHVRTVFLFAMTTFSLGTLVAAIAPGFEVLVAGRVVQAVGTAIMMPLLMTTILTTVAPERRGRMMGTISIVISVAPAIGPTVSGLILQDLSWRWLFWIVLPIALTSLALGAVWVRNVTTPGRPPLDVLSVVLSAVAFAGLIYGLSSIGESAAGHAPVAPWIPIVVGAIGLVAFVTRQLALGERALMDLRAFRTPAFSIAVSLVAVSMMALFGTLILLPIYLQTVLGRSTLETGLVLLPGGLVMGLLAPIVGRLFDRHGPRPLVAPGAVIASGALWAMSLLDVDTALGTVIAIHVVLSVGLALMFTPLLTSALGSLPQQLYPHGSAIVGTAQQVAGAAGTALFVTVMTRRSTAELEAGLGTAAATAEGVHAALLWGGIISAVAIVVALFVKRPPRVEAPVVH